MDCAAAEPGAAAAPALAPAAVAPGAAPAPASSPATTTALHSVFTSGSSRPRRGSEASKLKFPVDVPDVGKSDIVNFVLRHGRILAKVTHRNPSSVHYCWDVRLITASEEEGEFSNEPNERAQLWSKQPT